MVKLPQRLLLNKLSDFSYLGKTQCFSFVVWNYIKQLFYVM